MLELKVQHARSVTPRVRSFELVATDGADLPPFTAGSHIDVMLGNGEERSYSLLNNQDETHRYVLAVLREPDGQGGSAWVHDVLADGDILRSSPPSNNFKLSEGGDHHILIAGGIGVTPILSMATRLKGLGADYTLHYCARDKADAAFADEIAEQHAERAVFHFDGGNPARGLNLVELLASRPLAAHAYVCGPAGMIRAAREAGKDWPKGTVHYELFKGSEEDLETKEANEPFDIILQRTGKTLNIPADRSILEVLKENGYKVKTLCREGVCGTCRVELISGAVDHRDDCLEDDEREEALQVCVSRAMPGETLVLDL